MLSLINFLIIICFFISLFSWRYLKDFSFKMANLYIGIGLALVYIFGRLRFRPIIILDTSLIAILLLIVLLLCFVIILCFYYFRESSLFISSLKFLKNYYQTPFRVLHYVLFYRFSIYAKICDFLLNIFPQGRRNRLIAIFFFNIVPFSFLNIIIFKQLCLGFFNLEFLLLLTLVQFFNIWIYSYKFFFDEAYRELLPLYNKMVTTPDTLKLHTFVLECSEEDFLEALQNAHKIKEIFPLFNGRTPEEYVQRCVSISLGYRNSCAFQNFVSLINRYAFRFTFSLSFLILFLLLGESLSSSFISYSFSFLNNFYYLYF